MRTALPAYSARLSRLRNVRRPSAVVGAPRDDGLGLAGRHGGCSCCPIREHSRFAPADAVVERTNRRIFYHWRLCRYRGYEDRRDRDADAAAFFALLVLTRTFESLYE